MVFIYIYNNLNKKYFLDNMKERSYTGFEFKNLSEEEKIKALKLVIDRPSGFVFSRTDPAHKRELV